jgi:hypothetical protein
MAPCPHMKLDFVGEQKSDDGVNAYYRCHACGDLLVVTPANKVLAVSGIDENPSPTVPTGTSKS